MAEQALTELFSSADVALARRIEAGHAQSARAYAGDANIERIAGGWAIFHQPDSAITQAIGIGLHGAVEAAELDRLEAFFHARGSAAVIDLCTLADASVVGMIQERGYTVREISHALARRLDREERFAEVPAGIAIESAAAGQFRSWARLMIAAFSEQENVPEEQVDMLASAEPAPQTWFGWVAESRVATAAMAVHDRVAILFGDATLVPARGRGLHLALIRQRLEAAAALGCDLATASVLPGSVSHRNYERAGFQLVYARIMVSRAVGSNGIGSERGRRGSLARGDREAIARDRQSSREAGSLV